MFVEKACLKGTIPEISSLIKLKARNRFSDSACIQIKLRTNRMRSPWMSSSYIKDNSIVKIKKQINGNKFVILLSPEVGSWIVLDEEEEHRYDMDVMNEVEMETLYLKGLALDDQGERVCYDFPKPAEYPSVAVINITTNCNLCCTYCFAGCSPTEGEDMCEEVMIKAVEQMFDMPTNIVTFEIQGGEPLCFLEGMKRFIEIAEKYRAIKDKEVKYRTVTNCTLISDDFIELTKKYDIKVGISIDGPKEMTDKVRIKKDGTGAFYDIMNGITKLRENGVEVDGAVCTIGKHNCMNPEQIASFFLNNNISFKPRPANILGRELLSKTTTRPGEWADVYKKLYYLTKKASVENFSIHIFEENTFGPVRDYICLRYPCGAAREIVSINPNGDVFPCDGFKGEKEFVMGSVLTETLKEMIDKEWVQNMRSRTSKEIKKCSKCNYRAMCCSCCYSAYGAFGDIYREDPHCRDRRKIFDFLMDEWIKQNIVQQQINH